VLTYKGFNRQSLRSRLHIQKGITDIIYREIKLLSLNSFKYLLYPSLLALLIPVELIPISSRILVEGPQLFKGDYSWGFFLFPTSLHSYHLGSHHYCGLPSRGFSPFRYFGAINFSSPLEIFLNVRLFIFFLTLVYFLAPL